MKAISLFSGCGGFDLGVQKSDVHIQWANDIDPSAASAYRSLLPNTEFHCGDIRKVNELPKSDILIGCYPCTGFSLAARRRWKNTPERNLHLNDTNFLFEEFLRVIDIVQPKLIFIENVRGMLSADNGYFYQKQLNGFRSKGFENISMQLLNAQNFGVAQSRQRVFFVGFHKSLNIKNYEIESISSCVPKTMRDVIKDLPENPTGEFYEGPFHGHYLTRNRKRGWDKPSFTIVADGHHVPLHPSGEPMSFVEKDKWKLNGEINRRLSWRECARIQGLPDNITVEGTLMDKYRVVGNAVPPLLSEHVTKPAIEILKANL